MHCNKISLQVLLACIDNDLENYIENNTWKLEHKAE